MTRQEHFVKVCSCTSRELLSALFPKGGTWPITWHSVLIGVMDVWGLGTRSMTLSVWQLLYRPGYFIGDYISGKRKLSFPPVKMLFIIALIYANIYFWFFPEVLKLPLEELHVLDLAVLPHDD